MNRDYGERGVNLIGLAQKVDLVSARPVSAGNADVSSAFGPRRVIPDIENNQRFSRFALSADGTSALPAIVDGLLGRGRSE